jgi:hypothetical protein
MKTILKISSLALLLCIGFIPTSTGASFEPAKTVVYLGDNNPGNYSLLQFAIQHGSNQDALGISHGTDYHGSILKGCSQLQNLDIVVVSHLMRAGYSYQVPFHLIGAFFSDQFSADANL